MKKTFMFLMIAIISIIITAEPYRPYPQIYVHGYNTSSVKSSNFGITMKKSVNKGDIEHCIANQPYNPSQKGEMYNPLEQSYYVSKFKGDSLEEGKLAALCLGNNTGAVILGTVVENVEKVKFHTLIFC